MIIAHYLFISLCEWVAAVRLSNMLYVSMYSSVYGARINFTKKCGNDESLANIAEINNLINSNKLNVYSNIFSLYCIEKDKTVGEGGQKIKDNYF